ncbi:hypothetical protein SAMD00023353_5100740 [Rosellinia necatrix]|uniref:N-acetyltransferase domain-containing protein n=1 Tax=Rosellinia necatrix TaxID=77044 RepID=A0A1W2TR48_ROSNE|nr:hypothetical protein SAMD00023353_5100740 [Rosellinia necatrix]
MPDDVNPTAGDISPPWCPITATTQPEHVTVIRPACESDIEAIAEVETTSFPQVYTDAGYLADCRRRELEGGYPCCRILAGRSGFGDQTPIHGFVMFESYLRSHRQYCDSRTGEGIALPANRPPDRKPAYNILMAATRADPALIDEEFLFVSEICIHPHMRKRGNGTRLMRHVVEMADMLAVKIIVLAEGSVSDAAEQWAADEAEEVDDVELAMLREREEREESTATAFYQDKLGFKKRAYFFWGRRDSAIPRIFHVMQYP